MPTLVNAGHPIRKPPVRPYRCQIRIDRVVSCQYQERANLQRPGNRARDRATVLTFEMKGYGL